jgi:lipid-binding SYLF domain-containing protein
MIDRNRLLAVLAALFSAVPLVAVAGPREERIVQNASTVFEQLVSLRIQSIPNSILSDAEGVAIIPNLLKGGFVVGARHGKGVLLVRDEQGLWELPIFISLTGGNIGWQVGVQSTDLVLVFKTRKSVEGILNGKLTLGADAAAAAGPVGRKAAAATDGRLRAEIYSYSRSRGLFAGVSVDGSVLRVEHDLNAAFYGPATDDQDLLVPEEAVQLVDQVAGHCRPTGNLAESTPRDPDALAYEERAPHDADGPSSADDARRELAVSAGELLESLDPQWISYLAVPTEVFREGPHASQESLQRSVRRHEAVQRDAAYETLTRRSDFKRTLHLLRAYERTLAPSETAQRIPPPPIVAEPESVLRR